MTSSYNITMDATNMTSSYSTYTPTYHSNSKSHNLTQNISVQQNLSMKSQIIQNTHSTETTDNFKPTESSVKINPYQNNRKLVNNRKSSRTSNSKSSDKSSSAKKSRIRQKIDSLKDNSEQSDKGDRTPLHSDRRKTRTRDVRTGDDEKSDTRLHSGYNDKRTTRTNSDKKDKTNVQDEEEVHINNKQKHNLHDILTDIDDDNDDFDGDFDKNIFDVHDYESDDEEDDDDFFSMGFDSDDDKAEYDQEVMDQLHDKMQNDFSAGVTGKNAKVMKKPSSRRRNRYGPDSGGRQRGKVKAKIYSNEYNIKRAVLSPDYDKTSRPVMNDSTTVTVFVGMSLFHILDTNEKMQTLSALIAIRLRWMDEYLRWNSSQYGGVEQIWVPAMHIWTPDIFINNFADDSFQDFMNTFAIINSDGLVLWMFPAVIKTYCTLDVRHFPFDQQKCDIVFISWTFNGFKVDITYNESEHSAIYYKPKNQEWYVDKVEAKRHEVIYACCKEPYPDVTFTIHMTRRSLFYIINLIFPCLLIYTVSFLGFFLPAESGEKVNLEITILLALVVFLLMVGETLPPTPDAIPALGLLFGTTMIMVSIALVMAVIVTNLYLRKDSGKRVPYIARKILLPAKTTSKTSQLRAEAANNSRGLHDNHSDITRSLTGHHYDNSEMLPPPTPHHHTIRHDNHNDIKHVLPGNHYERTHNPHHYSSVPMMVTGAGASVADIELDNVSQLSDQDTPICNSSRCRRRRRNTQTTSFRSHDHQRRSDPEYTLMCATEWQILAKIVDKIFFWLFLFSSVAIMVAIFAQIPNVGALI